MAPIMSELLNNTTLAEGEKGKYYVGESGKVYYQGFEYEGKIYYNKDKNVEGTNIQIEPGVVPPVEGTAAYIAEHPTEYYGAKVNYTKTNGQPYIVPELPTLTGEYPAELEWRVFYSDGSNIYLTTKYIAGYKSFYDAHEEWWNKSEPIKETTYVNEHYADWSTDGITYEIFKNSYNQVKGENIEQNLAEDQENMYQYQSNTIARLNGMQKDLYYLYRI